MEFYSARVDNGHLSDLVAIGDCRRARRCKFRHVPTRALMNTDKKEAGEDHEDDDDVDDLDTAEKLLRRQKSLAHPPPQEHLQFRFNGNDGETSLRRQKDDVDDDEVDDGIVGIVKDDSRGNTYNGHGNYHQDTRQGNEMPGLRRIDHLLLSNDAMAGL